MKYTVLFICLICLFSCSTYNENIQKLTLKGSVIQRDVLLIRPKNAKPNLNFNYKLESLSKNDGVKEFKAFIAKTLNCSEDKITISFKDFTLNELSPIIYNYKKKFNEESFSVTGRFELKAKKLKVSISEFTSKTKKIFMFLPVQKGEFLLYEFGDEVSATFPYSRLDIHFVKQKVRSVYGTF